MRKELICINCPLGCPLTAEVKELEDGTLQVVSVEGNTCPRGADYAGKELTAPARIITSTVRVKNGVLAMVPVKTASDVPKGKMFDCVEALKSVEAEAPVQLGDVILADVAGTGVDVIATRTVEKK